MQSTPLPIPPSNRGLPPRLVLWITAGLFAGQAWAVLAAGHLPLGAITVFAAPCLAWWRVRGAALGLALFAAAFGHQQVDQMLRPRLPSDHVSRLAGQTVHARGRIVDRPSRRPQRTRFTVEVQSIRRGGVWQTARGRVQVTIRNATHVWTRGEEIEAAFRLRQPRNFGNPGEFDYESFLARRQVHVMGYASTDRAWTSRFPPPPGVLSSIETWREEVRQSINDRLGGAARQIVSALLIGDASSITPEVRERYARSGLSHVLVISGLHIGLVAGAAYGVFRWLLARSEWLLLRANVPKLSMGLAILPILLYGAIAGGNVPTLRAVVMILLVLAGTTLDRPRDWLVTLAVAALFVGILWPGSLFEISFQLSFAAVAAIVIGMKRIAEVWRAWEEQRLIRLRRGPWGILRWLVFYQAATLCAMLGTAPLGAWHFNRVSLIGVVANPLLVPLIGMVPVGTGLIAVLLQPFAPELSARLLEAIGALVTVADHIASYLASLPGASIRVVSPSRLELTLIYATLAAVLIRPVRPRRFLLVGLVGLLIIDAGYWVGRRARVC
jgi:competence protein ComEC